MHQIEMHASDPVYRTYAPIAIYMHAWSFASYIEFIIITIMKARARCMYK